MKVSLALLTASVGTLAGCGGGGQASRSEPLKPPTNGGSQVGDVVQTNKTWTCTGPVQLRSVKVTVSVPLVNGKKVDAVKLGKGCTGAIGRIDVTQKSADGIKVSTGAHDIKVSGGSVVCASKAEDVHQDGVQVMGGSNITFEKLKVDCGRPGESLINSNLFINMAGEATTPPSHVICKDCTFGGDAAHTVSIQHSTSSGVTGSTLCPAKYGNMTLAVGADATSPVTGGNTYGSCSGQNVTAGAPVVPTMQH